MARPNDITAIQTGKELKQWYWLKQELVAFAKHLGISAAGSKFEILERLANALDNIPAEPQTLATKSTPQSRFNWATEALTTSTVITDSYKNSQNVPGVFSGALRRYISLQYPIYGLDESECRKNTW
ncbi:MAG: hypothetical protein JNN25_19755 [Candidatus Kapabacteria bacterium]|nr:hypothetical protein [Candidatus Kapabacteria bacterium]